MDKKYKLGYTTGVFDLFHIGHLNILRRAKEQCETLIVGVSTDELVQSLKKRRTIIPFEERMSIVSAIKYVDIAIPEIDSDKIEAHKQIKFDALFKGSDWDNTAKYQAYKDYFFQNQVDVVFFPYTEGTSSTKLTEVLNQIANNRSE